MEYVTERLLEGSRRARVGGRGVQTGRPGDFRGTNEKRKNEL